MLCERCFQPLDQGEHGVYLCPLERRPSNAIWTDEIPGGLAISHGLCNEDGTPRTYYSHSAIRRAAHAKGIVPYHDIYAEGGETRIKDAQVKADWQRSSEAQRAKRDRDEARAEKRLAEARR